MRFKSAALLGHNTSKTHTEIVKIDLIQKGSIFQKTLENKRSAENKVMECVMRNLYFIMIEESPNHKASHLNSLVQLQGVEEMKYFKHRSERVQHEMRMAIGDAVAASYMQYAKSCMSYGLLIHDLSLSKSR